MYQRIVSLLLPLASSESLLLPSNRLFFFFNQQQIIQKFGKKGAIRMKFSAGVYLGVQIHTCIPRHSIKDVKVDLTYHWLAIICQKSLFKGCEASLYFFYQKQKRMWSNEAKEKTEALKYLRILGKKLAACESCKLGIFTQLILSTNIDVKMPIQPPSHLCYRLSFLLCLLLWLLLLFPKIYIMIRMRQRERDVQTMFK